MRFAAAAVVAVALTSFIATTGKNRSSLLFEEHPNAVGAAVDRAFVELMVPEERVRLGLAVQAASGAEHPRLRRIARLTKTSSGHELRRLLWFEAAIDADVPPGATLSYAQGRADSGALGLVPHDAGLSVSPLVHAPGAELDRQVINRLIRLGQGAVRITRAVYSEGDVTGLRHVASRILQRRFDEIFALNRLYLRWFGRPSRAGGVPAGA